VPRQAVNRLSARFNCAFSDFKTPTIPLASLLPRYTQNLRNISLVFFLFREIPFLHAACESLDENSLFELWAVPSPDRTMTARSILVFSIFDAQFHHDFRELKNQLCHITFTPLYPCNLDVFKKHFWPLSPSSFLRCFLFPSPQLEDHRPSEIITLPSLRTTLFLEENICTSPTSGRRLRFVNFNVLSTPSNFSVTRLHLQIFIRS